MTSLIRGVCRPILIVPAESIGVTLVLENINPSHYLDSVRRLIAQADNEHNQDCWDGHTPFPDCTTGMSVVGLTQVSRVHTCITLLCLL